MEEIELICDEKDIRLDAWLTGRLQKFSRSYVQQLINENKVLVNGKNTRSNYKMRLKDQVLVTIPDPQTLDVKAEKIDFEVLYEDDDIIVVNKPRGMVVHPAAGNYSGTLVNALMDYCGDELSDINGVIRPGIVHRIDKDTSGVLVIAKNNQAHERLSEKLKEHDIKRIYAAVVEGVIREQSGKIDAPIGRHPVDRKKMAVNTKAGRRAVTYFKVLERYKDSTYIELQLETGRTHQIRVHMSYIGHPLVGDEVYGRKSGSHGLHGQALHARVLGIVHPATGRYMEFESELPLYFQNLLKVLRENYGQQ